jgi:hypothetical protein
MGAGMGRFLQVIWQVITAERGHIPRFGDMPAFSFWRGAWFLSAQFDKRAAYP